jgi:hypothetical protein
MAPLKVILAPRVVFEVYSGAFEGHSDALGGLCRTYRRPVCFWRSSCCPGWSLEVIPAPCVVLEVFLAPWMFFAGHSGALGGL